MDQNQTPLLDAIVKYTEKRPAYFKIPGHRYGKRDQPPLAAVDGRWDFSV